MDCFYGNELKWVQIGTTQIERKYLNNIVYFIQITVQKIYYQKMKTQKCAIKNLAKL